MLAMPDALAILGLLATISVAIIKFAPLRSTNASDVMSTKIDAALLTRLEGIDEDLDDLNHDMVVLQTEAKSDRTARDKFEAMISNQMESLNKKMDMLIEKMP